MSYGVGWFGRVFGTLGMFGSVVFFCNGGMFGAGVFLVRECFWCGSVFGAGRTTSQKSTLPRWRSWGRPPIHEGREKGTAND